MTTQKLSAEEIGNALMRYYKCNSIEELMETDRFKQEFAKTPNKGAALMAMNRVTEENITASGVYIKHGLLTDYDEKARQKIVQGEGPVILFLGGKTKMFAKKGETNKLDGNPCEKWVQVEGITRKYNIAEDRTDYVFENAEIVGDAVPSTFPDVPITGYLNGKYYCMMVDQTRGTISGQTSSKSVVFATGTILPEEDMENGNNMRVNTNLEYHKEPHVKVRVEDSDGNIFSTKIPFTLIEAAFGLDEETHYTDVKETLGGQPIAVQGVVSFTHLAEAKNFEAPNTEPDDYHVLEDAIDKLENLDFFIEEEYKGNTIRKLSLKGKKGDDGKPIQFVRINKLRVYDLQEVWDKKKEAFVWQAQVHHEDLGRDSWFSAVEKRGTYSFKNDDGEMEEREWVYAPGGYIRFLNNLGGEVTLPEDNPFAQLAASANLYEFEEKEEETTTEAPVAETPEETPTSAPESSVNWGS